MPWAESPKTEAEADQVELERTGARASYVVARKAGALAGGSAKVKLLLSALTRRIHQRMTQAVAHGPVTRDQRTFPGSFGEFKEVISQNDVSG